MNDIETIKEIYRRYWKCMIDKDESGLCSLMSDDYYLMHMHCESGYYKAFQ